MRKSQLANAEIDFSYRYEKLQSASMLTDIITSPVVFGILNIEN